MLDKIKWFWGYYKNYKYVLMVLLILTPIQVACHVVVPRIIEFTIDFVRTGETVSIPAIMSLINVGNDFGLTPVATLTLVFIALGVTSSLLYAFIQSHRAWMNTRLEWLFRQEAFNKITDKGPDFFNKFRIGDLVTRLTDDVAEKLSWFACSGIFRFYEALLMVAFTIVMMASINPALALWSVGSLPLLIIIFSRSSTILDRRYDRLQTRISKLNAIVEACFSGIRVVKAYVQEEAQKAKFKNVVMDRRNAEISAIEATTIVDSLYMYIWQFGVIIVLLAGGYMVINSGLSLGKLVAFIFYVVYLVFPMFDIGQFLVKSRQSSVSIDRLRELERVSPMVRDHGSIPCSADMKGHLAFSNVEFAFPDTDRKIIDNVSLEIRPGQTVAFVGKVGSGKSWLAAMIPRLIDPSSGSVMLDGHDLREYELGDLRKSIGFVPQEPSLFSDTIRNNVLFGRDRATESNIEWALDISQLRDEIDAFPKGIESLIGTRGVSLSGGQKQRLAMARALAGMPRILILDDCTSALDSRTEAALWENLQEVLPDLTVILITHRPDILENAGMIYVMDKGRIVESGKHLELMLTEGRYSRLYRRYQLEQQVGSVS